MMDGHLTGIELMAYVDDELTGVEAAAVREHCVACPACRAELEALRRISRRLVEDREMVDRPSPTWAVVRGATPEKATPLLVVGAVAACLLGIVLGVWAADSSPQATQGGATTVAWNSLDYLWSDDGSASFLQSMTATNTTGRDAP